MSSPNPRLRQPIVVVLGHTDAGKTSLLDSMRGTAVQAREAGGITQQIGASYFPLETLQKICGPLLSRAGGELQIPGLLVIDTPGHAVFSNLRLRGGSAADIAILVVDVMKGLENQTLESIDILKQRKVPFVVALNKIDMIRGWRKGVSGPVLSAMKQQAPEWNDEFEERLYNVVGGLSRLGFQADAYYRVKDFRQQVSIVPTSARHGTGIPELLAMLIGLAQQFLKGRLVAIDPSHGARGIILELQEEEGMGQTANVVLTEGVLSIGDNIVLVRRDGATRSKVKALFMPKPLDEMRDPRDKFTPVESVYAAAGVKLVSTDLPGVVAGTSIAALRQDSDFEALKAEMEKELKSVVVKTDNMGVIVKAGNVGGLEALLRMLEERGIAVRQADIGDISRNDIVDAKLVGEHDPYLAAILAFDVKVLQDAKEAATDTPIFLSDVIYEVIDNYVNWATKKKEDDERAALSSITLPCKFKAIPGNFFRRNDPAVFGVEVLAGKLKPKVRLMGSRGEELGTLEQIQDQGKSLPVAEMGNKVAISVKGPTLGRQIKENDIIYSLPTSHEVRLLRNKFLGAMSQDDLEALDEIVRIRSVSDPLFGF
jgi:translation initiation factor 5B